MGRSPTPLAQLTRLRPPQERPSSKERELVFEAVTATMKQLKGSYSIISLISQARRIGWQCGPRP